jgi:hypothetical protein
MRSRAAFHRVGAFLLLAGSLALFADGGVGQDATSPSAVRAATRSVVKIASFGDGGAGVSGSGVVVHPAGYILTSFHVVGHVDPDQGLPGTLINRENRYTIATVDGPKGTARYRFVATVVRANVRRDVALLRIVGALGGGNARRISFPAVTLGSTTGAVQAGTRLWALGYPSGSRRPVVRTESVRTVKRNHLDQLAWIELSPPLDAGMSGGLVADDEGRIVAVMCGVQEEGRRGRALPTERVPRPWLSAMREGRLERVRVEGVPRLALGEEHHDVVVGDVHARAGSETHYYYLPPARPLMTQVWPILPLALLDAKGEVVRSGAGALQVRSRDPSPLVVAVTAPSQRGGLAYTLHVETLDDDEPPPKTVRRSQGADQFVGLGSSFFVPSSKKEVVPPSDGARVEGTMVDALTGRPISGGTVIVGRAGTDVGSHLTSFLLGELGEGELRRKLAGYGRTDVRGRFDLGPVHRGRRYSVAAFASGYRPATLSVNVAEDVETVRLGRIEMTQ